MSFRSKFSGFHLENITCPVRYLRVPLGSCQSVILWRIFVLHISGGPGWRGATYDAAAVHSPCTEPAIRDDAIRSDGGQAYGMERSSVVILRVPFLSADFPVFSPPHRRRSKREIGLRPQLVHLLLPFIFAV